MAQQLPQIHSVHSSQRRPAHGSARPAAPSLLARVPWGFLAVIAVLVAYGLVVCWSAVQGDADYNFSRQLQGVAVGLVAMVALWAFDYRRLSNLTTALLVINVVLILLPHIPGLGTDAGMGAKSWIKIGMQVQPGEFAKVTVVLFAASLLARYQGTLDDWREYCKVLGMLLVPFAAIMTQPDLGTGLVYMAISAVVLVMGGAKGRYLLITLIAGIAAIAAVFAVDELLKYQQSDGTWEYRLLKNYQRSRLLVFLNPEGAFPATATTSLRPRSPSAAAACSAKASGTPHSRPTAFCPRPPRTSSSAFWPRSSGSWASWRFSACTPCSSWRASPSPGAPTTSSACSSSWASSACGSSRFWRTSAWTAALCPSRASRCPSSATAPRSWS